MPILHDNRNMRPDLLNKPQEDVNDIFANADAAMAQQRQKQLYSPKKKKINWRKRWKQTTIITSIIALVILLCTGVWGAKIAYKTGVAEIQTQVLQEVSKIKNNIAAKDESELTDEDLFFMEVFTILSDEDIVNIIQTATSAKEVVSFLQTAEIDFSKYLTEEQQLQLEDAMNRYAYKIGTEMKEYEDAMENDENFTESVDIASDEQTEPSTSDE